ncbi:MAG TPA: acyl-CoA dehydrogenase family protein [Candidatus Binatia bacterium]|jgi:alkylation response protein AidB-like acyl-CoA dehydrogenase|nr:acyl-CoA dehydrogenase family protein [Candidatus Binatia bacterium]
MDFSFSPKDLAFADEARTWLDQNLPAAWRRDHCWSRVEDPMWIEVAREWQRKLHDGGWAAISWPREAGGRGATVVERWFFDQALDQVGAPRPPAQSYVDLIGPALLQQGTPEQRERFLAKMVNGDELWCQGFSEPGAGSDLAGLRTRAERRGDEYVVNGQKVWTSHADIADWCFLLCRTEADAPKHKGISLLLVDMKSPGISVRPLQQMTDDAEFCEVFFEDVRVPATNLLGAPGAGWNIAMGIVQHERGPMWTFVFQRKIRRCLSQLLQRAKEHPATAGKLRDPAVRQRLAQAHIEVEILRLSGYRSLTTLLRTGHPGPESSLDKVVGSETDQRLQELSMQLFGPYGSLREGRHALGDIPRHFLYSFSETIMGGTSEIQRNVIAQRILGLPR